MTRRQAVLFSLLAVIALSALYTIVARQPLAREARAVGLIPVEIFVPSDATGPRPAVVLAHGYAASKQSLYAFGQALARAGYVAVVFDFSGHGANRQPFSVDRSFEQLASDLQEVITFTRALPAVDPSRIALLGHSMGARVVVEYAITHPGIAATVALSGGRTEVTPEAPRNLLLLAGAWEPAGLKLAQARALDNAGGTSNDFATGRAREAQIIPAADHLSILWNHTAQTQAALWMRRALPLPELGAFIPSDDWRMGGVFVFSLAAATLFLPLLALGARWLPPAGATAPTIPYAKLFAVLGGPALVVPFALRFVRGSFLDPAALVPIHLAGDLATFWLLYGLGTAAVAGALGVMPVVRMRRGSFVGAGCCVAWLCLTVGLVGHRTWIALLPTVTRWTGLAVVTVLSIPYFVLAECLVRVDSVRRSVLNDLTAKGLLLASLGLAGALNPPLGSLLLLAPLLVAFLALFGVYGAWTFSHTRDPLITGLAAAAITSMLLVAAFPLLALAA